MLDIFLGKIWPFREIGFCTYLYRNIFHLSGDPACKSDADASLQCVFRPMALPYPLMLDITVQKRNFRCKSRLPSLFGMLPLETSGLAGILGAHRLEANHIHFRGCFFHRP
jgi:hypothetical protein